MQSAESTLLLCGLTFLRFTGAFKSWFPLGKRSASSARSRLEVTCERWAIHKSNECQTLSPGETVAAIFVGVDDSAGQQVNFQLFGQDR